MRAQSHSRDLAVLGTAGCFYCLGLFSPLVGRKISFLRGYLDNRNKDCTSRNCGEADGWSYVSKFCPKTCKWKDHMTDLKHSLNGCCHVSLCCPFYLFLSDGWSFSVAAEGEVTILGHGSLGNENSIQWNETEQGGTFVHRSALTTSRFCCCWWWQWWWCVYVSGGVPMLWHSSRGHKISIRI